MNTFGTLLLAWPVALVVLAILDKLLPPGTGGRVYTWVTATVLLGGLAAILLIFAALAISGLHQ